MKNKTRIGIAPKTEETALRSVIFAVQNRWFALPVGAVLKVSLCPPINNSLPSGLGTIDMENETVTVIDLEEKFAPNRDYSFTRRYLFLVQTQNGEKCGLVAASPPSMVEIPLNTIRTLPSSYRQQSDLSFVSHLAVLPKVGENATIDVFLFGVTQLLGNQEQLNPSARSQQQLIQLNLGKINTLLPVGCVVKAIPFQQQNLSPIANREKAILGTYLWQGNTLQILDLNQLLGYSSLLKSETPQKPLTILIIRLQNHYAGILIKAVRQLAWYDLRDLTPVTDSPFLQGKFDEETLLLNFSALIFLFVSTKNN